MKTRNLLIAALLLGGMTAFNSCSEKEIDNIAPSVDQPVAEELETALVMSAGMGDKIETRADDPITTNKKHSHEDIRNYAIALFDVDDNGNPAGFLAYYANNENNSVIFPNEPSAIVDDFGFAVQPLKFRTANNKVAAIVVANCDYVYKAMEDEDITDFASFERLLNNNTLPLLRSYFNNPSWEFQGYPMSSNVSILDITPGKYNTVGYKNTVDGLEKVNDVLTYYGEKLIEGADRKVSTERRILLYRCWSQVELTDFSVKKYSKNAFEAQFELHGAFLMNVPGTTNLITGKTVDGNSWFTWGSNLNIDFDSYTGNKENGGFYSGYTADKNEPVSSDGLNNTLYPEKFRTSAIADNTTFKEYFNRAPETPVIGSSLYGANYSLEKLELGNNKIPMVNPDENNRHLFNYIVSESNYGLVNGELQSDRSMVLVVEGVYKERYAEGGPWFVPNFDGTTEEPSQAKPRYYTIVIGHNVNEIVGIKNYVENTVMRNVKYEISAVIAGPGSNTPVAYQANSYIVPKVTVVPFGKVTQTAERD